MDQAEQAIKLPMRKTAYAQDRIGHRLPMRKTELVTEKEKGKISAVCAEVTYAKVKFFFFDIIKLKCDQIIILWAHAKKSLHHDISTNQLNLQLSFKKKFLLELS